MHVACHGAWKVEELAALRDRAEQRVVAARAFLLLVEPHGAAFGVASCALHRAVEVQGDARGAECAQTLYNELGGQAAYFGDAGGIGAGERAADSGHARQALEPKRTLDHLVVLVVAHVAQLAVAEQQMHNEHHHDEVMAIER